MKTFKDYIPFYEQLVFDNLRFMLDRYDPHYGFIDTKVKIFNSRDFKELTKGDDIYRKDIIFSYVQGRALEALAGHCRWLEAKSGSDFAHARDKIKTILPRVIERMEILREKNSGHVHFMMSVDGTPLKVIENLKTAPLKNIPCKINFSDLFYSKGLFAAAQLLEDRKLETEAENYFKTVAEAIFNNDFIPGHQIFDPKNPAQDIQGNSGKFSHGPYMILIGGAALMMTGTDRGYWRNVIERALQHILNHHLNSGQFSHLQQWDYVEFINAHGQPWMESDNTITCDPGHALEFIGLTCKGLSFFKDDEVIKKQCRKIFPQMLPHIFGFGFNREQGGLCKSFDLVSRRPMNSDMPWWNLPETMRAAVLTLRLANGDNREIIVKIFDECRKAFEKYLRKDLYLLAYQTRNNAGKPVDVIPAVPDADPCYHTGLSIIDVIQVLSGKGDK